MSEYATQLSVILVDDLFGELPSRVFGALAFHGRLPFSRLVYRTQLSPTELKHGLSILIQQQLVLWYDPDNTGQAFYEADIPNSYALARFAKYTPLVKDRFGDLAGDITSNVTVLGYVRVGDLSRNYFPPSGEQRPLQDLIPMHQYQHSDGEQSAELNGAVRDGSHSVEILHSIISDLLQAGLLCLIHESQLRPVADNVTEAKRVVFPNETIGSKKAQQAAYDSALSEKLDEWKYGSEVPTQNLVQPQKGTKRAFEGSKDQCNGKKRKLTDRKPNGTTGTGGDDRSTEAGWLDSDLTLRVNHEKFAILIRNQHLVALVEESIGPTTAKVYAELLRSAEPQLRKCKNELGFIDDDEEQIDFATIPQVSMDEIGHSLHDFPDLADALGRVEDPNKINLHPLDHPKKVKRRKESDQSDRDEAMAEGSASSDESDDSSDDSKSNISGVDHDSGSSKADDDDYSNNRKHKTPDTTPDTTPKMKDPESPLHTLRQHLILLAEHAHQFLIPVGPTFTASDKWAIPYPLLSRTLLQDSLLNITTTRFGSLAGRLFRILSSSPDPTAFPPKLDEKALVLLSLIPQKPMRTLLHSMHRAGHIELQELPKDGNQRRPGTTNFFWFFDAERMRKRVLEETYKSMANLIRRAGVEREAVRGVVEKSERTDVVGREEELLGEEELGALKEWRAREERLWGEVGRLDELVAVLRDF